MKKLININVKVFGLTLLLLAFSFSCAELDEDPAEVQISPETLVSEASLRDVIPSIYRALWDGARWTDFDINRYGGDDITTHSGNTTTTNKGGFRDADWRDQSPISERIIRPYETCYQVIANANVVINVEDNIVNGDKDAIDRYIGEAYFLRAYAYMHLTRTYGKVPLILKLNDLTPPVRAEVIDIYAQIESDLLKAEQLLPDMYPGVEVIGARPSKGAAKAFLARLYMHWAGFPLNDNSKYALAAAKAGEVVNGSYGYALAPTLREMWTIDGRMNHNESVFSLISCFNGCGGNFGNRNVGRLGLVSEAGGWQEIFGEIAFYEDMEAAATADGTLARFEDTYVHERITRSTRPFGSDWRTWSDPHPILRKAAGSEQPVWASTNAELNIIIMRYADVLLMYAEATGRSGGSGAGAWEALNMVRRRAAGNNPNTADPAIDKTALDGTLAELAYTERKWELAGEGERWYDLQRMQRFTDPAHVRRSPIETSDVYNNRTPNSSGEYLYFTPLAPAITDRAPSLLD
jgi:hypothetical protein